MLSLLIFLGTSLFAINGGGVIAIEIMKPIRATGDEVALIFTTTANYKEAYCRKSGRHRRRAVGWADVFIQPSLREYTEVFQQAKLLIMMKQKGSFTVFLICVVLLCLKMRPASSRSLGLVPPEKLTEGQEKDLLQEKLHIVGQLLLNCLVQFDNSDMPDTPVPLTRHSPYTQLPETSMTDELRSMIRQMERQLIKCREIQMVV